MRTEPRFTPEDIQFTGEAGPSGVDASSMINFHTASLLQLYSRLRVVVQTDVRGACRTFL